ncbi:MAG TPA: hypothetical protein VG713_09810 [Pirellulales bacterium]|nr:hypothetical protein [Pirellulales bacterium]
MIAFADPDGVVLQFRLWPNNSVGIVDGLPVADGSRHLTVCQIYTPAGLDVLGGWIAIRLAEARRIVERLPNRWEVLLVDQVATLTIFTHQPEGEVNAELRDRGIDPDVFEPWQG